MGMTNTIVYGSYLEKIKRPLGTHLNDQVWRLCNSVVFFQKVPLLTLVNAYQNEREHTFKHTHTQELLEITTVGTHLHTERTQTLSRENIHPKREGQAIEVRLEDLLRERGREV